ncbi:MAG: hypothetical protein DRI88_02415 [Bacteroidetes bacterium]|nr:MAG: hypothetical protein DRI88_02415 [Bacteroidota bacterium]
MRGFFYCLLTYCEFSETGAQVTLDFFTTQPDPTTPEDETDLIDDTGTTYHKILMAYNMCCKDGLVSVPGNTNLGCGEWDYSCNTYITDSAKVNSVINFTVTVSNPNGQEDEYSYNNSYTTSFGDIHVYADGQILTVQLKTNNYGHQSSYILYKDDGTVYYERDNCDNNTLYNDPFYLNPGCYKLQIFDSGNDGLEFWANPGQGEGYFRILNADSDILYSFEPDFGGYAIHEFGIGNITKIDEIAHPFILSVYPNPVSDHLQINIRGTGNTKVTARLSNTAMKQVMEKEWTANEKEFSTVLDMKDLPSGVYFLQITYGNHSKTEKIIIF